MSERIVKDGYDRNKHKREYRVRPMTLDEVKALRSGQSVKFIANDGTLRDIKINGEPKRWKTDPDRVEVPVKYGLREYWRLDTREEQAVLVVVLARINPLLGERWA